MRLAKAATAESAPTRTTSTLDAWAKHQWDQGVQLEALAPFQSLDVSTRNTTYHIVVVDGPKGEVLVTGGRFFPTPTRVRVNGCSLGGSCLKWRGIYCGFRIEFQIDGETIVTTRVKTIAVLNTESSPDDPVH
jgi:hypothetical protein